MAEIWNNITNFLGTTGANVLLGFGILFIGLFAIKIVSKIGNISLQKAPIEKTVVSFISSLINMALYILLIYIVAITMFPETNAGIIAALGSAALAIGLALKDSLANFASGIIIIVTKPFKQGDYVVIGSTEGTVESVGFMSTTLTSPDNKLISIANRIVLNNSITNNSAKPTRRVDFVVSVKYGSDITKTKEVLLSLVNKHPKVLNSPSAVCRLNEYGESSLDFTLRCWVRNADYWDVKFDINEELQTALKANGIEIPFKTITIDIPNKNDADDSIDENYVLDKLKEASKEQMEITTNKNIYNGEKQTNNLEPSDSNSNDNDGEDK
ncbi:MAG: mechanosensitive ion channel family protein [Clostridia bacterium]|nr:mechanosensitive ion channel family protein [Clostridia bacterium]